MFNLCSNSFEALKTSSRIEKFLEIGLQDTNANLMTLNQQLECMKKDTAFLSRSLKSLSGSLQGYHDNINDSLGIRFGKLLENISEYDASIKDFLKANFKQTSKDLSAINNSLETSSRSISSIINALKQDALESNKGIMDVSKNIGILDQTLQQINCDSKDMNQNLFKLKSFLEEVERHLDLKR